MSSAAHRENDLRACGATTIVIGQSLVKIDGQLWAVEGDICSHGDGQLISTSGTKIRINGKRVIVVGDTAAGDDEFHDPPLDDPVTGSSSISMG